LLYSSIATRQDSDQIVVKPGTPTAVERSFSFQEFITRTKEQQTSSIITQKDKKILAAG